MAEEKQNQHDVTTWKESPILLVKGFLMGSADIVPGVSGGTLALITGIYDRLIYAISSFDAEAVRKLMKLKLKPVFEHIHWKFFLILLTGIFLAIFFFTRVVPLQVYMYTHPEIVYGLFFGLIVGSVFLLMTEVKQEERTVVNMLFLVAGAGIGFWIVNLVPEDTPQSFWFVMLSGSVAICAMVLPGISGSYILLILGKYDYILSLLGNIGTPETASAIYSLIPFVLGAAVGLILFSRLLSWLLRHYHTATLLVLIGFLIGTLYVIWPYQNRQYEEQVTTTEIVPVNSPLVDQLQEREEVPAGPEYKRMAGVQNGDIPIDERGVVIETVSRNLVSSTPYFPFYNWPEGDQNLNIAEGVAGILSGLIILFGVGYLRNR